MSLFEESGYQYRETCFVLFLKENRPTMADVARAIRSLGERYELSEPGANGEDDPDVICVKCPYDHSAMDISYVEGDDVIEQLEEMQGEFQIATLSTEDRAKLKQIQSSDARFDVFHFEELVPGEDPEDGMLDPGAMLVVLQTLARLTGGVGIDSQSGTLL